MNRQHRYYAVTTDSQQNAGSRIDPIQFEVVRFALTRVAEEMAAALRRSAYSTNVKTRQDFSCAFFDRDCRPISQAFTQPVHLGSFVELIPTSVRTYGAENLNPGDMLVVNNPFGGGSHLNDVTVFGPVHHNRDLVGYVASLAHHVDVGGGAPASIGPFQEIFQEGVIIPPVKIVKNGEINADVFKLILAQIRSKRVTTGDFRAQIAANTVGARRLVDLVDKYGLADSIWGIMADRSKAVVIRLTPVPDESPLSSLGAAQRSREGDAP